MLDEVYKLVKNWKIYFRTYRNYFQWVTVICVLLTAWPIPPKGLQLHDFQYSAAAVIKINLKSLIFDTDMIIYILISMHKVKE